MSDRLRIQRLTPTHAILQELGQRLATVRQQQGLTQQDLAAAAGIGIATLRRIEDGKDSKLGSWLRLLLALQMESAIDQLLPAEFRSPMAEVKGRRRRRRTAAPPSADGKRPFAWGDERP
jgi:transcriptional regulator with XRE-family HTH domain